jgi:hypothetical protein
MSNGNMRRAQALWVFGLVLTVIGFLPVMVFVLRALLPSAAAAVPLPDVHVPWAVSVETWFLARKVTLVTSELVTGLVIALPGVALMALGAWIAQRQGPALEAGKLRREDALRRARHYRAMQSAA